nr:MAG TPA: hypothetical protein [Caudoviricetes sp.]
MNISVNFIILRFCISIINPPLKTLLVMQHKNYIKFKNICNM